MTKFDWQTENEITSPANHQAETRYHFRQRHQLFFFLVFLVFVAIVGNMLYKRLVTNKMIILEAEAQDTHEFVKRAAQNADIELFDLFVSDADQEWAAAQKTLVQERKWLDRRVLDLYWNSSTMPLTVTIAPNMTEAEVVVNRAYTHTFKNNQTEIITLEQTIVYRLEDNQWAYASPPPSFWGEWQMIEYPRIQITYPNRDEATARRLAEDLNEVLTKMCEILTDINCLGDFQIRLRLDTDPSSQIDWEKRNIQTGHVITLPTPTLVGIPINDRSYTILFEGYARSVVSAAISDLVGWHCCENQLLFKELLSHQLRQLNLPEWDAISTPEDEHRLQQGTSLDELTFLWEISSSTMPTNWHEAAHSIVNFLLQQVPETSVAEWQRRLVQSSSYSAWLAHFTSDTGTDVHTAWLEYLYNSTVREFASAPLPLPDRDALMLCGADLNARHLVRYNPAEDELSLEFPDRTFGRGTYIVPAFDEAIFLVESQEGNSGSKTRVSMMTDGREQLLWDSNKADEAFVHQATVSPDGRYLAMEVGESLYQSSTTIQLLDVSACQTGQCITHALPAWPVWSQDGKHMLFNGERRLQLGHSDSLSWKSVLTTTEKTTAFPFWLDNNTYGFFYKDSQGNLTEAVAATVTNTNLQTLFSYADLQRFLPSQETVEQIEVIINPAKSNEIIVAIFAETTSLFSLNLDTKTPFFFSQPPYTGGDSVSIAPHGHWITLSMNDGLTIYSTTDYTMETIPIPEQNPQSAWSPDGRWLLAVDRGQLLSIAPEHDYIQVRPDERIIHCNTPIWVERP